jgi:uncharacterized protein YllA (UPF0747 family)
MDREGVEMAKKGLIAVAALLAVLFVFTSPTQAGQAVQEVVRWTLDVAGSVADFIRGLLS